MKRESNTYEIQGRASIDTTLTTQQEVLADIRSIRGVTIVSFSPINEDEPATSNKNYVGILDIKVDNFPFERFDKKRDLQNIINLIRRIPAINFFRPDLINLLENETL
jgi:hypothetical protein